MILMDNL